MDQRILNQRREALNMPLDCLAWRSRLPVQLVEQILSGAPANAEYIAAVRAALGLNEDGSAPPPDEYCRQQALIKAEKLTSVVQGSSALEGQGLDERRYQEMVVSNTAAIITSFDSDPYRLWTPL